jgi:hypothetical protein
MDPVIWTVYPYHKGEKSHVWHETRTFDTKRKAVETFTTRKPKTAILRQGHTYYIEMEAA